MRVITGLAKGRKLQTLPGNDMRPTSGRVKEAIFSIIQFEIEGRHVLDLFAGSGQLGIEALSRNAASATFVDNSFESVQIVKANLQKTGLWSKAKVLKTDFEVYLSNCKQKYDIAFLDPPYHEEMMKKALQLTAKNMSEHGIIICEHYIHQYMPQQIDGFFLRKSHKFGKTIISVYRKGES